MGRGEGRASPKSMCSYSNNNESLLGESQGVALLAALILMTVLGLMGTSIFMAISTEITISGNFRRGVEAFYLAEAGIEEARARLKGSSHSTQGYIGDPVSVYDNQWSAYVLTSSDWRLADDENYSTALTNYIPTQSLQTNKAVMANSLQTELPYWVKIRHKTEYDAERSGHRAGSPHYLDHDGSLDRHTKVNRGHLIFYGYPTGDSSRPVEFTTGGTGEGYPIEMVAASAGLKGGSSVIEVEVVHHPGPKIVSGLYARNGVTLTGKSSTMSGVDRCGVRPSTSSIYTLAPSITSGNGTFTGSPSGPSQGPLDIDLDWTIESFRKGARFLTVDQIGVSLGSISDPWTVYVNAGGADNLGRFTLQNVSGFGILAVEGHVQVKGPLNWQGLIINTGTLTIDASTGPIQVFGGVWSDQVRHIAGEVAITYDSCAIKTSLLSLPLTIINWRQIL